MPVELGAVGDVVTGAIVARTIEPAHGDKARTVGGACLNCGAPLMGAHCHACGQKANVHRTLRSYGHDLLHGVFHFEGKIWRTLPMLAFKPGDLTRRYIHGERAKFVSPLALFLFSVFLMFAVFETTGGPLRGGSTGKNDFTFNTLATKSDDQIGMLTRERAQLIAQRKDITKIDALIADEREGRNFFKQVDRMLSGKSYKIKTDIGFDSGSAAFDERVQQAVQNPKLLLYRLQSSAYKFAWALIPLSLPFMWLMFAWQRQYKIYDHAIFVTYSLSFVMLLLVVMAILGAVGISSALLLALPPIHFFLQLQGAYALRWQHAAWRTIMLVCVAFFVLITFGLLLLALGLMG